MFCDVCSSLDSSTTSVLFRRKEKVNKDVLFQMKLKAFFMKSNNLRKHMQKYYLEISSDKKNKTKNSFSPG